MNTSTDYNNYKLVEDEKTHEMYILVISAKADSEVYDLAGKR